MATAQQDQVVRLHCVVAEGHVSHEVAEVSCLHQPLPRCRGKTTPSGDPPRGAPSSGRDGERGEWVLRSPGRGLMGTKEGPSQDQGTDPRPRSLPLPPTFFGLVHYISILFSQNKALFHVPPNGFLIRNFLSLLALPEGETPIEMPTPEQGGGPLRPEVFKPGFLGH